MRFPESAWQVAQAKSMRALAPPEDRLAELDRRPSPAAVSSLAANFMAARLARDVGRDRAKVLHRLAARGMRPLDQVGAVEALQLLHAPQQPRLEVHHLAGVGEVARQFGEGAIDHARPLAEIAFFQRHLVRAGGVFHSASPRSASSKPGLLHGSSFSIWRYFSTAFSVSSCAGSQDARQDSAQHAATMVVVLKFSSGRRPFRRFDVVHCCRASESSRPERQRIRQNTCVSWHGKARRARSMGYDCRSPRKSLQFCRNRLDSCTKMNMFRRSCGRGKGRHRCSGHDRSQRRRALACRICSTCTAFETEEEWQ